MRAQVILIILIYITEYQFVHYPYVHKKNRDWNYRRPLVLDIVKRSGADIVCLQVCLLVVVLLCIGDTCVCVNIRVRLLHYVCIYVWWRGINSLFLCCCVVQEVSAKTFAEDYEAPLAKAGYACVLQKRIERFDSMSVLLSVFE